METAPRFCSSKDMEHWHVTIYLSGPYASTRVTILFKQ